MRRVTLTDRDNRETQMREHVKTVAAAITGDLSGDAVFGQFLHLNRHCRNYSLRNRMLIAWQAPDSRKVASRTAFSKIAEEQGHAGVKQTSKKGKSWEEHVKVVGGARAVWIWGNPRPVTRTRKVTDAEGNVTEEPYTYTNCFPVDVYQVEDILYADTGEPFVMPSLPTEPVHDPALFDALLAFAASKGIEVKQEGLGGAAGISKVGAIGLQQGDPFFLQVSPLIHELAHEGLHDLHSRLEPGTRKLHEGEAEATAAVVLNYLGYETPFSAAYLRNWNVEPQDVLASMERIAKFATEVVDFVEAHQKASGGPQEATGHAAAPVVGQEATEALAVA